MRSPTVVRTRCLLGATAVVVVLAACSVKPNPSASTTASTALPDGSSSIPFQDADLTGTVVHPDGSAAAGVPLTVTRLATNGEKVGDFLTAVFTGGLACIPDNGDLCAANDQVVDQGTTGADGSYATRLSRAYVPGYQTDADWLVAAAGPAGAGEVSGPSSSYEMEVNTAAPVAPALPLWDQAPAVSGDRVISVSVSAPAVPEGATPKQASTEFLDSRGASVLSLSGPSVDARLLEDGTLRVVGARAVDVVAHHVDGSTTYHQHLVSAGTPYQGALVPLSRGKACAAGGPASAPCALTDGDLTTAAVGTDATQAPPADAVVDLGAPSAIGLVVARGCAGCTVETSDDAVTWAALPAVKTSGSVSGMQLAAGGRAVTARYVRVLQPTGLREISVWPPEEHASGRGGAGIVARDSGSGAGSGLDTGKVVAGLAAALLIGAVGGVGIGRRVLRSREAAR
jgi:hypothetical protein